MKIYDGTYLRQVLGDKTGLGLKLFFLFITVYLISTGVGHPWLKLPLLFMVLFLTVFFVKSINQSLIWYLTLTLLLFDLICDYFVRANHHFFLIYLTILIIIFLKNGRHGDFITNIKLLVFIVLLFSAIQKLLSPQFVSGDFYYYMFNTGNFFKPLLRFNPEMNDVVAHNNAMILELGKTDPNELKQIVLQNVEPNIGSISHAFAWLTIIFEILVAISLLLRPKHILSHLLFIVLIFGIFLMRMENGFLCLLAITGVWLSEHPKLRLIYASMAILFISLIVNHIGFY